MYVCMYMYMYVWYNFIETLFFCISIMFGWICDIFEFFMPVHIYVLWSTRYCYKKIFHVNFTYINIIY